MTDDTKQAPAANDSLAKVETIYRMDWNRTYPRSMERVWEAISNQDEITTWMKFTMKLELRIGGAIHIDFSSQGSLEGTVCNMEAPRLLIYTWGDSLVKWELEEVSGATRLHLSHVGVLPDLLDGMGAGWHAFLDQLEDHLTGSSRPNRYRELKSRYEEEQKPEM